MSCEHIRPGTVWYFDHVNKWGSEPIKFCPICGVEAKRPEEPMSLGDKLKRWHEDVDVTYLGFELDNKINQIERLVKKHYFGPENEKALAEHLANSYQLSMPGLAKRVCEWFRGIR